MLRSVLCFVHPEMPYSDYTKIREIGSGSFGKAYLVQTAGRSAVLKEVDMSRMDQLERAQAEGEVRVLQKLKHPYIVKYWESFVHSRRLCIVMDYCDGGDLFKYITQQRRNRSKIPEGTILRWFTQMSLAIKYMHEDKRILHRDIKTQNVFLRREGPLGAVKIADFGISKVLSSAQAMARTMAGTPYYLSPEMVRKQPYACPSDMWAMGCVLFELCALRVPFDAPDMQQLLDLIVRAPIPRLPAGYSRDLAELLTGLLERAPPRRLAASGVLQKSRIQQEIQAMLGEERKGGVVSSDVSEPRAADRHRSPARELNPRVPSPSPRPHRNRDASPQRNVAKEVLQPSRAASPWGARKGGEAPSPAPRRYYGA